jgi:signal transduction histidine kinase
MTQTHTSPDAENAAAAIPSEEELSTAYAAALSDYIRTRSEEALYRASILSQRFVHTGLGPEDIIALHAGALEQATEGLSFREQAHASTDALQFLLEVMIAYGINHREFLELRVRERDRESGVEIQRERTRAEEAERRAKERADLLQVVAHELRTPLAVVKGSLDLTRRALTRGQLDNLDRIATQAAEAVNRLTRMTNDLFEASRGTAAPRELAPLDLRGVVAQAFAWATTALEKDIHLEFSGEGEPLPLLGDADGLQSVVGNLLSNAIRYTPEGGTVSLRCYLHDGGRKTEDGHKGGGAGEPPSTDHRPPSLGGWAVVEVADTGIGMSDETKARIFEQFFRGPEAYEQDRRGLGLGLALVRQLVLAHNGRIEVESTLGKGSTFRVLLPLLTEGEQAEA